MKSLRALATGIVIGLLVVTALLVHRSGAFAGGAGMGGDAP